jgi:hypothetical protein
MITYLGWWYITDRLAGLYHTKKITERAYYYYLNGWGSDKNLNFQRATKMQAKLEKWSPQHEPMGHHGVYNSSMRRLGLCEYDYYDFDTDSYSDPIVENFIYLHDDVNGCMINKLYGSTKCCNHNNRTAKFYFYYKVVENCVPGLGPFCDDCVIELDENKIKEYSDMIRNIIEHSLNKTIDDLMK